MTANRTTLYAETPGITGIKTVMNNLKAKYFKTRTSPGYIFVGSVILALVLLILFCCVCTYFKRRKRAENDYYVSQPPQYAPISPNAYYMSLASKELRASSTRRSSTRANYQQHRPSRSKSIY
jgi:hypothetical protein